jgi:hypothetical protein
MPAMHQSDGQGCQPMHGRPVGGSVAVRQVIHEAAPIHGIAGEQHGLIVQKADRPGRVARHEQYREATVAEFQHVPLIEEA